MELSPTARVLIQKFHVNNENLNQQLEKCIMEEMTREGPLKQANSNIGGWQSDRDLHLKDEGTSFGQCLLNLFDSLHSPISYYLQKFHSHFKINDGPNYEWDYTAAWINVSVYGSYNTPHTHSSSAISGAYYIRTEDPTPEHPFSGRIDFYCDGEGTYEFPKTGMLILFPGTLFHFVHPYYGSGHRICLSFNTINLHGVD